MNAKSILTATSGFLADGFTHTLNPYSGCAFGQQTALGQGCPFCYVRRSPAGLFGPAPWGEWVTVKQNAPELLEQELGRLRRRGKPIRIFMSSSTDPFQAAERTAQVSRRCLEVLVAHPPDFLVVQTRSLLVRQVLPLLRQFGDRVMLSLTLETDREDVRRLFTPTSPPVAARLKLAGEFRAAGVPVQVAVSPVLPHDAERFATMLAASADRVVVDTLFDGDGAGGARSEGLGMRGMFERLGFGAWYSRESHLPLLEALRQRMGEERVFYSCEGFNSLPSVK
ncbi:MAG: photolyase [Symbiobacteriaceae bacterium]|nr:photolyase [Symbiobacteriaceae bacterium]